MSQFQVRYTREVVEKDEYIEVIEAPDAETAETMADALADRMDHDCPDGVTSVGGAECGGWTVEYVMPVSADSASGPAESQPTGPETPPMADAELVDKALAALEACRDVEDADVAKAIRDALDRLAAEGARAYKAGVQSEFAHGRR